MQISEQARWADVTTVATRWYDLNAWGEMLGGSLVWIWHKGIHRGCLLAAAES